jgi:hypothetical protein
MILRLKYPKIIFKFNPNNIYKQYLEKSLIKVSQFPTQLFTPQLFYIKKIFGKVKFSKCIVGFKGTMYSLDTQEKTNKNAGLF